MADILGRDDRHRIIPHRAIRPPTGGELVEKVEKDPAPTLTGLDPERLFAAAPEPLFVVRDDRIELANDQAAAFLGCDPVGLDIHEVIPEWVEGADAGVPFEASLRSPVGGELPGEVRVRRLLPPRRSSRSTTHEP